MSMAASLPNRQTHVNGKFAYLALAGICQSGKSRGMQKIYPNRIRAVRDAHGMTIEQLAEAAGLSVSYVSRLEKGERNLSVRNMNLLAHALKVDAARLLNDEVGAANNVVAVMGRIGAGAEISPDDEQIPPEGLYEIETPFSLPDDAIAFEVVGESMWPRYDPGDIIICWRQGSNADEVLGWEAAVKTSAGARYLKRVLRAAEGGRYDLESHNAAPIRGVSLVWVAAIQSVIRSGQWQKLSEAGRKKMTRKMLATG